MEGVFADLVVLGVLGERLFDVDGAFRMIVFVVLALAASNPKPVDWELVGANKKEYGPISFWCLPTKDSLHSITAVQSQKRTFIDYTFGPLGSAKKENIRFDEVRFFLNRNREVGGVFGKFVGEQKGQQIELVLTDNPTRARGGGTILANFSFKSGSKFIEKDCSSNRPVPVRFRDSQ